MWWHRSRPLTQLGARVAFVPKGKGRWPARYCVKLLINRTSIAIVAFLVSLGQRPLRGPPQFEDRPYCVKEAVKTF